MVVATSHSIVHTLLLPVFLVSIVEDIEASMDEDRDWNGEVRLAALAMDDVADSIDICRPKLRRFLISFASPV